jgi:hypothetical protein
MKKLHLITTVILFLLIPTVAFAATELVTREIQQLDESLSEQNTVKYADPQKILLTQIKTEAEELADNPSEWYNTLYYYSITRAGYADIPYNYVIDRNGEVYEGRSGGDGVVPELYNDEGAIVIGYLSSSSDITDSASDSIKTLISDISYKYGIDNNNFEVVELQKVSQEGDSLAKNQYTEASNSFSIEAYGVVEGISFSSEEHMAYTAEVLEINAESTVKGGEKLNVEVKIKNVNDFAWFADKDYIYLSVKDGKESSFAVNGVWDSFSKPLYIEQPIILPEEVLTLNFEIQAKLLPGSHTESFELLKLPSKTFEGSSFTIAFDIEKGDFDMVRVNSEEAGFLNVRDCASTGCNKVGTVEHDSIYVVVEKDSAWYKVEFEEGKQGWIYGKYVEQL